MEKETDFEKELEEVFSGNIYKNLGLKDDPFTIEPKEKVKVFVDRTEPFNKLIRGIRNMIAGSQPHIAVLGSHGIGKTHFIEFAFELLKENKEKVGIEWFYYIKGKKGFREMFLSKGIENSEPYIKLKNSPEKKVLIFFDDIDITFKKYPQQIATFFELFNNSIIGTWDSHAWGTLKNNTEFKIPKTEAVYIDRLDNNYCRDLLMKRIKEVCLNDDCYKIFPEFVINKLAIISDGNPYKLITYSKRYLDFLLDNNLKEITETDFEKFCNKLNVQFIDDIKRKLKELTEKQRDMISFIIESIELSSKDLAGHFNLSRVGAMMNLKILRDKKILDSKTKERTDFYYVPTELVFEISDYLDKIKENKEEAEDNSTSQSSNHNKLE